MWLRRNPWAPRLPARGRPPRRRDAFTLDFMEIPQGAGSGFIWDGAGHVVTNYHVVKGASDLQVGRPYTHWAWVVIDLRTRWPRRGGRAPAACRWVGLILIGCG